MVGREYWTKGYFYNIDKVESMEKVKGYGFYNIGKGVFLDEYGNEMANEPKLLGAYGVATITGIAREIAQELIISGIYQY